MAKGNLVLRWLLFTDRLHEKTDRLSRRQKRWMIIGAVLLILALIFTLRYHRLHKYDSVAKIETLFHQNETEIRHAAKVLTAMPKQEEDAPSLLMIAAKDAWDSTHSELSVRDDDGFSIVSVEELTEQEYQAIIEAVRPLFRKMPMVFITVSPDRFVVDFELWRESYFGMGHCYYRACIVYDSNEASYNEETRESCNSRHIRLHSLVEYPTITDVRQLEDFWFAVTSK